jgi:hypothetical protein
MEPQNDPESLKENQERTTVKIEKTCQELQPKVNFYSCQNSAACSPRIGIKDPSE